MRTYDGHFIETIGYGHHAASGEIYTNTLRDLRGGVSADIHIGTALVNDSAKTALRLWYARQGYARVTVLESEYPGSFIVKGLAP
jgi:hypothetical protein